jgi:hypothetical protein
VTNAPIACLYKGFLYMAHEFPRGIPPNAMPLYAALPPTQPLTEDEIEAALGHDTLDYRHGFTNGVRHAELTHHIK